MIIRAKLELTMTNDEFNRMPSLDKMKLFIENSATGFNLVVIYHKSLYEYKYDTKGSSYSTVDSRQTIGHVKSVEISNDELYLIIDTTKDIDVTNNFMVILRSELKSDPTNGSVVFDTVRIFCIDMIQILDNEDVGSEYLSKIEII